MFRKLVSNLPFSPTLVGQLGFYARRLRKEEATRKLGLIFTILALVVQSLAVFSPPEPANAASSSDFIRGGIKSKSELLTAYDSGNGDLKDIFTYAGVTRAELAATKTGTVNSKNKNYLSWGRVSHFSASQGEVTHVVPRQKGGSTTVYSRPLYRWDSTQYTKANGSTYQALIGHSAKIGWFAILKNCANLVTTKLPKAAPGGALTASCTAIKGYAYDGRRPDLKVKVTLYLGGPPGKGAKLGQIIASASDPKGPSAAGSNHGFSVNVPQKYKTSKTSTAVYGVMTPLSGWTQSTVSIGQATIPGNCTPTTPTPPTPPVPSAACTSLTLVALTRTQVSLEAKGTLANGAKAEGFRFTIKDAQNSLVKSASIPTTASSATTQFELSPATYTASATFETSTGDKTATGCQKSFTIAPPEKCPVNPNLEANSPDCQPCPGDASLWIKDSSCEAKVVQGKLAANLTQNKDDAQSTTARSSDRIEYTIYVENIGLVATTTTLNENLKDVLEYATIQDNGGGAYDADQKRLYWDNVSLAPGERQTRKFVVEVKDSIPATAQGISDPASQDCKMTNTFGNTIDITMSCPPAKTVERVVTELPKTGPGENIAFAGVVLAIVTYFYLRSRQLGKEVRLVRHDFTTGNI